MSYDDLRPWDRQPKETEKAYAAFKAYLDMSADGGERNLSELARRLSKSRQLLTVWKSRHHWEDRCLAWDKTVMEAERKAAIKERKKMVKRHIGVAMALQCKAVEALKHANVNEASLKDIVTMIVQGVKIERLTRDAAEQEQTDGHVEQAKVEAGAACDGVQIIDDLGVDADADDTAE